MEKEDSRVRPMAGFDKVNEEWLYSSESIHCTSLGRDPKKVHLYNRVTY